MAQIPEWGPHLWIVLHGYAEHAGSSIDWIQIDEIRAWIHMLRLTEGVLPCARCRAHYKEWRLQHPLEDLLTRRDEMFKEDLRRWIWGLHESVNTQRDLTADQHLPFEGLVKYKSMTSKDLQDSIQALTKVFEKAILHRQVNATYVAEWKRSLSLLRKFIEY